MPTVTFESSDGKLSKTVPAPDGGSVADLCDDHEAPIPFSCRSASCATCHIEVLEGQDAFQPPESEELDVLEAIDSAAPRFRLACCAKLKPGSAVVRVRAQNDY
ncbi:MAG: (2Fe-2S)-binding protein [Labilithrix sp.]|nr:(2Fe-2S)-binding protein [Labilithrix sp.]